MTTQGEKLNEGMNTVQEGEETGPNTGEAVEIQDPQMLLRLYGRPSRNAVITGINRSGTSLFCVLLNELPNLVALNEVLYDVDNLPLYMALVRHRLLNNRPVPNKFRDGRLTTNPVEDGVTVEQKEVDKEVDEEVVVASKVNVPYLVRLQSILEYGFRAIAVLRHPVYTIASWNRPACTKIPEAHVTDDDMHERWENIDFPVEDRVERQALIWNYLAGLIWQHRGRISVCRYEEITGRTADVLHEVSGYLGVEPVDQTPDLENLNRDSRYSQLPRIRRAVRDHCPNACLFGYSIE